MACRARRASGRKGEITLQLSTSREVGLRGHRVQSAERAGARYRAILLAAAKVFADRGYFAATMEDIAEALGGTKGVLYYYFRGKEEIYAAIRAAAVEDGIERLEAIINQRLSAEETLRAIVTDLISHMFGSLDQYAIIFEDAKVLGPDNRERIRGLQRNYEALVIDVVRRGMEDGTFARRDPTITAFTLLRATLSVAFWYRPGGRLDPEKITQQVTDQVMTGVMKPCAEDLPGAAQ